MGGMTRGSLGAEVYWRRRLLVLAAAFLLVLGIGRVLGASSDGSDGADPPAGPPATAVQAGAGTTAQPSAGATDASPGAATPPTPTPSTKKQIRRAERAQRRAEQKAAEEAAAAASAAAAAALPDPQGACSDTDVVITPSVPSPVAGSDVVVDLELRTRFSPACSWTASPDTIALTITSGKENIWSVQDCPAAVPTQDLVLRRAVPTTVQVTWNAKRSDDDCTDRTTWALPGFYHVLAAALAGEPTDVQFELTTPAAPQVTRTAEPQTKGGKNKAGEKTTGAAPPG